jgi:intracellular sulfur oxidation DsrE/DsrF family protein
MEEDVQARRSWLSGLGVTVAAFVLGSGKALAQSAESPFRPARHPEDDWLEALPGEHRTFIDSSTADGAGDAMLYANNLYLANQSGYGLGEQDVAVVVCLRHASTVFAFNDAMWAKYGKVLSDRAALTDPKNQQPPSINPLNTAAPGSASANRGITLDSLVKKGAHFAVCSLATRRLASMAASATGGNADAVVKELMANAIANSHFVPAGVVAVTRAQERGYTLLRA